MKTKVQAAGNIQERVAATGLTSAPASLLAGAETLAGLRSRIIELTEACPPGLHRPHSPFRILSGLSYASLTNLVNHMPLETCLSLFELELESRCQAEAGSCAAANPER